MVEVCRTRQQWVGSIPIDTSIIPHVMTAEELHAKISSLEKATYITVYALSAILLGIPPLVLAVIPSNQKETKAKDSTLMVLHIIVLGIGETYSKNSSVYSDLNIISAYFTWPALISGTDVFHCVKKEKYGNKSGLTNEVLNPKDKQADEVS
ncbi:unnamed protein product [Rhizophagus irregularis]|nr:unnamed protein product [Rhizophagus irregularis]